MLNVASPLSFFLSSRARSRRSRAFRSDCLVRHRAIGTSWCGPPVAFPRLTNTSGKETGKQGGGGRSRKSRAANGESRPASMADGHGRPAGTVRGCELAGQNFVPSPWCLRCGSASRLTMARTCLAVAPFCLRTSGLGQLQAVAPFGGDDPVLLLSVTLRSTEDTTDRHAIVCGVCLHFGLQGRRSVKQVAQHAKTCSGPHRLCTTSSPYWSV